MDAKAWISLGAAFVSVVACVLAVVSARRSQSIAIGQAETAIRSALRMTRQAVRDLAVQIATVMDGKRPDQLRAEDKRRLEPLQLAFREAVEDNLNAYEDACAKYIDGKIDRARFKKSYIEEIRTICQQKDNDCAEFMIPETTSKFQGIWKVFREWHVHEK